MKRLKRTIRRFLIALAALILLGFIAVKSLSEPLPTGIPGQEADALAQRMLMALNQEAYLSTDEIYFSFGGHHYFWNKAENKAEVRWSNYHVLLELDNLSISKVYQEGSLVAENKEKYIEKAVSYFYNDSYWLVAPFKLFDPGVSRKLVRVDGENDALLVTHSSGGVTPGDSYLWILDEQYRPVAFKMWVSIIPVGGISATWEAYQKTDQGTYFATRHKIGPISLFIRDLETDRR